jgi:hypothetical protein
VNAALWSDGAYKERYIALPGDNSQIEITASGGWNFPDRAVLVKSFALDVKEGKLKVPTLGRDPLPHQTGRRVGRLFVPLE